jgi:hypothetical protein
MKNAAIKILGLAVIATLTACSGEDSTNTIGPAPKIQGRVSVTNSSIYWIEIIDYVHSRGRDSVRVEMGSELYPGYTTYLRNAIDPARGQIFEGGDNVRVRFRALEPDPGNPGQPLFQNTVDLIVNGSQTIQIKDGGEYSISPE